jgi:septum formation protein
LADLVLASTSRYRRTLLERLGLPFRCLAPPVDEEALKDGVWEPRALAEHLALAKARSLGEAEPDATIIGGDQLVAFEGRIYGKPGTVRGAVEQLSAMSGSSHQLITALAVWHRGLAHLHTDTTTMWMRQLTRAEIE